MLAIWRATEHSATFELNCNYEKICFNVGHCSDRRRVYNFLHTTGNYRNFDHGGGNCQSLAHSVAGKEEEDRGEKEESRWGRGVSLAFGRIFSCADTIEGPSKFLILELRAQVMDAPVESALRPDQDHP